MHIEHLAVWVNDLENMKDFYHDFFETESSELYYNEKTGFRSYFLTFSSGARLELTNKRFLAGRSHEAFGYAHLAIAVGSKADVDCFAQRFVAAGLPLLNGPRTTGDGYYEAVVQDPEGNLIELTTG